MRQPMDCSCSLGLSGVRAEGLDGSPEKLAVVPKRDLIWRRIVYLPGLCPEEAGKRQDSGGLVSKGLELITGGCVLFEV